jgi:tRNA(adenine34) deaminase
MRIALEEAVRGGAEGNVAVGSVIVKGETVVARGRNLVTTNSDPTAHAETVALRNAGVALQRTDFSGYTLYTTFEPCPMCCGAILASGITTLVMGARHTPTESRWGDYTIEKLIELANRGERITVVTGVLTQECADAREVEGV